MKKIILLLFVLFLVSACEDILVEKPKAIATETFYNTVNEVASATNAIYYPFKNSGFASNFPALMESWPDYGYGRGSFASNSNYAGLDATNISRVGSLWLYLYLAIRNANLVIKNTPNGTDITDTKKSEFIGEAKFMRAFCYYNLVRCWGGVPLRTEETLGAIDIPRSSVNDVYDLILSDLENAQQNLPDAPRLIGTPSKWAAKTFLAEVQLTLKNWDNARDLAKEVIESGKYSLVKVSVADDFYKIFGPAVVNTTEEIFYIKFSASEGWVFPKYAHHPGSKLHAGGGFYGLYTTTNNLVYANWDNNDLRKNFNWYSWNIGIGSNTLLNKKFISPVEANAPNDYPIYRYADLLLIYSEAANQANNGPTAEAVECLNKVHRRAYGFDPGVASPVDFKVSDYNKESFFDLVLKERGYETMFEGKRWLDLVRTGKAAKIIKEVKGIDIQEKHYLFPIPTVETDYNKAINPETDQNPGY